MINEDQLEQLALEWFQDTGWTCANRVEIAPGGNDPQRPDFRTMLLKGRRWKRCKA